MPLHNVVAQLYGCYAFLFVLMAYQTQQGKQKAYLFFMQIYIKKQRETFTVETTRELRPRY